MPRFIAKRFSFLLAVVFGAVWLVCASVLAYFIVTRTTEVRFMTPGPALRARILSEMPYKEMELDNYTYEVIEPTGPSRLYDWLCRKKIEVAIHYQMKPQIARALEVGVDGVLWDSFVFLTYEDYRRLVKCDATSLPRQSQVTAEREAITLAEEALTRRGVLAQYVRKDVSASGDFWIVNYDYADPAMRGPSSFEDMTILVSRWTGKVQVCDNKVKGQPDLPPFE